MAEETRPADVAQPLVDDAGSAAEGTRRAALWIASALGSVPSLAILGAVVRDPGRGGFDTTQLGIGIGLAAFGALLGVLAFAWVNTPIPLTDKLLTEQKIDLERLPGLPYSTFEELVDRLEWVRAAAVAEEREAATALQKAATAEASAAAAELEASRQAAAAKTGGDASLEAAAARARVDADRLRGEAVRLRATAAAKDIDATTWRTQLGRHDEVRTAAFRLYASDVVRRRFRWAIGGAVVAVAAVAGGVFFLGIAPLPEPDASKPAVSLVRLTLNDEGRTALGCSERTLEALRIGGEDARPVVVTLPTARCPSRGVVFTASPTTGLGSSRAVEQIGGD